MNVWLTMIGTGLLTYATRLSFILLFAWTTIPPALNRTLRFVPPAVLTAIILPDLLLPDGLLDLSPGNGHLVAGVLAAVVAWQTKSFVITIVIGMAALFLLQALAK